jgi:hypothetical protein
MSPSTPKAEPTPVEAEAKQAESVAEKLEGKSSQAQFSTYAENTDVPETNPPAGKVVSQELGEAAEGPVKAFGE